MDPIIEMLESYRDLNSSVISELYEEPSALEFMRFVALNRPFVVRGGAKGWKATKLWNLKYLKDAMKEQHVNVAITPTGYADSPVSHDNGNVLFVKPWEEEQSFSRFLNYIIEQELEKKTDEEVWYAQTQNDNLRGEYAALLADVHKDIPWARIALQKDPEAINLWIGNSRSVSALHKDNYENIYCQIVGRKHFVLLPPLAQACVAEMNLPPASYHRQSGSLKIKEESEGDMVPFPTFDPDTEQNSTRYSNLARPIRTTLEAGDMLYLPALWYHKVSQSCSKEGLCCAVNYWHDMSYNGSLFPLCSFARNVALGATTGNPKEKSVAEISKVRMSLS